MQSCVTDVLYCIAQSLSEVSHADKTRLERQDRISAFDGICLVSCFKNREPP